MNLEIGNVVILQNDKKTALYFHTTFLCLLFLFILLKNEILYLIIISGHLELVDFKCHNGSNSV